MYMQILHFIGIVQQDHRWRMLAGLFRIDGCEGRDDHLVADREVTGRSTVHADGLGTARRFNRIGLDTGTIGDVPDINTLIGQDAGGVQSRFGGSHRRVQAA